MSLSSFCSNSTNTLPPEEMQTIHIMKEYFNAAQIIVCIIGIGGNMLNVRTLQSPTLQTVPFMYIRVLAYLDLISLSLILFHLLFAESLKKSLIFLVYSVFIEVAVINSCLVAGLHCALVLTLERYLLISRPHRRFDTRWDPQRAARWKIFGIIVLTTLLYSPMSLQRTIVFEEGGNGTFTNSSISSSSLSRHDDVNSTSSNNSLLNVYKIVNNKGFLCEEPIWTIFTYYKMVRECLRFVCVVAMCVLNLVIAKRLRMAKKNRRRLVTRNSCTTVTALTVGGGGGGGGATTTTTAHRQSDTASPEFQQKRDSRTHLIKSFTEKKLTALMVAICFIFSLGNLPQTLVMVAQNDSTETLVGFQFYRFLANFLEVLNHCLNFYVFCVASSEYSRAFLLNCLCVRNLLMRWPTAAHYITNRRTSSQAYSQNTAGTQIRIPVFDDSPSKTEELKFRNSHANTVRWSVQSGQLAAVIRPAGGPLGHTNYGTTSNTPPSFTIAVIESSPTRGAYGDFL